MSFNKSGHGLGSQAIEVDIVIANNVATGNSARLSAVNLQNIFEVNSDNTSDDGVEVKGSGFNSKEDIVQYAINEFERNKPAPEDVALFTSTIAGNNPDLEGLL